MVIKEGDKLPAGTSFQILGDGGPAVSVCYVAFDVSVFSIGGRDQMRGRGARGAGMGLNS